MSDDRTASPASPLPSLPGYAILAERTRDRLGGVYLARQLLYGREVSLRLVDDSAHEGQRDLTEVLRAARDAARHPHPQLVPLYEVGENESRLYLASDLPPGLSLRQKLAAGPLSPEEAAALVGTVSRAVAHLHQHHALHLGLSSACVYLDEAGVPNVGDLGLSGLLHDHSGPFVGDSTCAAPEQIAGHKADARADVYALGCLLAECLTGRPPAGKLTLPNCPPALARICRKAMNPRPAARYPSAAEMADDLDRFRKGEAPAPGALSLLLARAGQLPPVPLLVALLVVLLLAGGLTWFLTGRLSTERDLAQQDRKKVQQVADASRHEAARQLEDARQNLDKLRAGKVATDENLRLAALELETHKKLAKQEATLRRDVEARLRAEVDKRSEVEDAAKAAEAARLAALKTRQDGAREVERLLVAQGNALVESGDLTGALVPLSRALALARKEKLPEDAHSLRLALLLGRCPRPLCAPNYDKGDVAGVQFSQDGSRVLVVGADGEAAVRDAATGTLLGKKMPHGAPVALAALSPDGKRVLSVDAGGQLRLWNVEDATPVFGAIGLESLPVHSSFSGDGKRFCVVRPVRGPAGAGEAQVYDAAKGTAIGEAIAEQIAALPGALSADGSRVLLGCTDHSARVFDVATGKQVGPALEHGDELALTAWSADGKTALTFGGSKARVWVTATGKSALGPVEHTAANILPQLDESGRLLLTAGDSEIKIHDTVTGKLAGPPARVRRGLTGAALSADGRSVLAASIDGQARLLDVTLGEWISPPLVHARALSHLALSPTGARALTFSGRILRVWDLTPGEPLAPVGPAAEAGAYLSPDGKMLARVERGAVQLHDIATGAPVGASMKHKGPVKSVVFGPGGVLLTVADPDEAAATPTWEVRVWDAQGKPLHEPMEHLRAVTDAHFSGPNLLITISADKKVRLWDWKTGERLGKDAEHEEDVLLADLSPDGKILITSDKLGMTRAWDSAKGERVGEGMGHLRPLRAFVFSPDGKRLATCCEDGTACAWEIENAKKLLKVEHSGPVIHAAFNAEGSLLLTGSADGSARLWALADGVARTPPLRHEGPVVYTAFSEDGRWLLTASAHEIRLWDSQTGEAVGPPLAHARTSGSRLTRVALSKAGELTSEAGPGTRWVRSLAPEKRADAVVADLALIVSGREESGPGQLTPVAAGKYEAAYERERTAQAEEFSPPRARLQAWERRGARECEERGLQAGVLRHLDGLLAESADPSLLAKRGKARLKMGQFEGALADYSRALEKEPGPWESWANRAMACAGLKRWAGASADYREAIKREGNNAELWRHLGEVEGERGSWKESAEAFGKAARLKSADPSLAHEEALALLAAGDAKGYRELCQRLLKRFGGREAGREAVTDTCTLAAGAVADYKGLLEAAEKATSAFPEDVGKRARLAAVLLRAGQPARALEILEKLAIRESATPSELWLLVLSYQASGQTEKAREWQEKASAAKAREGAGWVERQTAALWQREAKKER